MDDNDDPSEDFEEEDIEEAIEDESSSPMTSNYGKLTIFISFFRQVFCVISVIFLPYHFETFTHMTDLFVEFETEEEQLYVKVAKWMISFFGQSESMRMWYMALSPFALTLVGRKVMILFCNVSYFCMGLWAYFFFVQGKKHHAGIYLAILHGVLHQFSKVVLHIYIAETSNITLRACFLGLYPLIHDIGNHVTREHTWARNTTPLFLYSFLISGCCSLVSIFIPESPFWLAAKGKPEAAERNFFWIKAGASASDVAEFDLLLDAAQDRREQPFCNRIFSSTFAICCSFAILTFICGIDPCDVQRFVVKDFYFPPNVRTVEDYDNRENYYTNTWHIEANREKQILFGCLVFMVVNFVIPRKMIFLLSIIAGALLAVPILLKLDDAAGLARIGLLCFLIGFAGVKTLVYVIFVEIFPASSRVFGFAVSVWAMYYMESKAEDYREKSHHWLGLNRDQGLRRGFLYIEIATCLFGIPYLMYYMPETKGRSVYEFREMSLSRPYPVGVEEDIAEEDIPEEG